MFEEFLAYNTQTGDWEVIETREMPQYPSPLWEIIGLNQGQTTESLVNELDSKYKTKRTPQQIYAMVHVISNESGNSVTFYLEDFLVAPNVVERVPKHIGVNVNSVVNIMWHGGTIISQSFRRAMAETIAVFYWSVHTE